MTKPIVAFRNFANAPKKSQIHCVGKNENFRMLSLVLSRYNDSLRAGRSGDRVPVGARFSAPVRTGSEAHPASYTMGTGSFPRVKRPGRGVDHSPPSNAEPNERVELYLYSLSGPSWPVLGRTLPLPFTVLHKVATGLQSVKQDSAASNCLLYSRHPNSVGGTDAPCQTAHLPDWYVNPQTEQRSPDPL